MEYTIAKKKYLKDWDDWNRVAVKIYYESKTQDAIVEVENLISIISNFFEFKQKIYDMRILDVGAGWGRHTLELYKRGFKKILAIDSSPLMKKLFERELSKVTVDPGIPIPSYIQDDFMNLKTDDEFDLILVLWSMFGTCDNDEENFAFLKKSAEVLKCGGRLVIETILWDRLCKLFDCFINVNSVFTFDVPSSQIRHWEKRYWDGQEWLILGAMSLSEKEKVLRYSLFEWVISDSQLVVESSGASGTISLRYYELRELIGMLSDAGFIIERVYGPLLNPENFYDTRITMIAKKL
ncbi:MAG: class I SAM-dependent methyltransferase [Candidatus Hydrothermales bacterium]